MKDITERLMDRVYKTGDALTAEALCELGKSRGEAVELRARIAQLQKVCAEAYQLAGAVGASEAALDNLDAAANGNPIPHDTFLPVTLGIGAIDGY